MRRMKVGVAVILAGAVLLLAIGCPSDETPAPKEGAGAGAAPPGGGAASADLDRQSKRLVGVWTGKPPGEPPPKDPNAKVETPEDMEISIDFKDDGTLSMNMMFVEMAGTWKVTGAEGDKLTVNTVMEMPSFDVTMESEEGEKVAEKPEVKVEKEEKDFTIVFETDDRITMAPTDEPDDMVTLTRQKVGE
jgi:hypothetical protein